MVINTWEEVFLELSPPLSEIILEYCELASLSELSEKQEKRLSEILEQASCSEIMAFWIAEVERILNRELGLLEPEACRSYQDQQALLREYLSSQIDCKPVLGYPNSVSKMRLLSIAERDLSREFETLKKPDFVDWNLD